MSVLKRLWSVVRPLSGYEKACEAAALFTAMQERGRGARLVYNMHTGHVVCKVSVEPVTKDRGLMTPPGCRSGEVELAVCHVQAKGGE